MNNNIDNKCAIMRAAFRLFAQNGYCRTGIRDIAFDAKVSVGLVNHHFGSKKNLAIQLVSFFWRRADMWATKYVNPQKAPVLYDAVSTRGMNRQMMEWEYRAFYIESLHEDIFFDSLTRSTNDAVVSFRKERFSVPDPDLVLLYGRILPYEVEKTLILKKESGLFQNIAYDDIPFYICLTAFEKIIAKEEIVLADKQARIITDEHIGDLYRDITDDDILMFITQEKL